MDVALIWIFIREEKALGANDRALIIKTWELFTISLANFCLTFSDTPARSKSLSSQIIFILSVLLSCCLVSWIPLFLSEYLICCPINEKKKHLDRVCRSTYIFKVIQGRWMAAKKKTFEVGDLKIVLLFLLLPMTLNCPRHIIIYRPARWTNLWVYCTLLFAIISGSYAKIQLHSGLHRHYISVGFYTI